MGNWQNSDALHLQCSLEGGSNPILHYNLGYWRNGYLSIRCQRIETGSTPVYPEKEMLIECDLLRILVIHLSEKQN